MPKQASSQIEITIKPGTAQKQQLAWQLFWQRLLMGNGGGSPPLPPSPTVDREKETKK